MSDVAAGDNFGLMADIDRLQKIIYILTNRKTCVLIEWTVISGHSKLEITFYVHPGIPSLQTVWGHVDLVKILCLGPDPGLHGLYNLHNLKSIIILIIAV